MEPKSPEDTLYSSPAADGNNTYQPIGDYSSPEYDNAMNMTSEPNVTEQQKEEWRNELTKLEEDIATLRQVLGAKVRQSSELKRKLGITPIAEFKADMRHGIQNIRDSDAYQKTNTAFKTAGAKTASAFSTVGAYASKKMGDMRNSNAFKSFEEKMGGAYSNMKNTVSGSRSEPNFAEAANGAAASNVQTAEEAQAPLMSATDPVPEEKVPL